MIGESPFVKNVFTLASGTAIAQIVPLAISPLLTRLYSPEDFGVFSVYFGFLMIASVFATGKFELAIVLPSDAVEAKTVLDLSIIVAVITSSILALLVLVFGSYLLELFNANQMGWNLIWLPLGILGVGASQGFYYFLNRQKKFGAMATIRITRSVAYAVLALAGTGIEWIAGLIMADAVSYVISAIIAARQTHFQLGNFSQQGRLKRAAIKFGNFPRFLLLSGLLEKGAGQAPIFLLTNLFGAISGAGFFSFAQRIIVAPSDLISRAIGDVFRQQASEEYAIVGQCKDAFKRTLIKLAVVGILPFSAAFFVVEDIFGFVFGEDWRIAGRYAKLMMPMFFLQFVVSPLSVMFVIAEKQKYDLAMQGFLLSGVLISFYAGFFFQIDIESIILMFTSVYIFKYLVELVLSARFSGI